MSSMNIESYILHTISFCKATIDVMRAADSNDGPKFVSSCAIIKDSFQQMLQTVPKMHGESIHL